MTTTADFPCPDCDRRVPGYRSHDCGDDIEYETWTTDCPDHGVRVVRL